jgi:hypothetical protein
MPPLVRPAFTNAKHLRRDAALAWLEPQIEERIRGDPGARRNIDALRGQWAVNLRFANTREGPEEMPARAVLSSAFVKCVDRLGRFDREDLAGRFTLVVEAAAVLASLAALEGKRPHTLMKFALGVCGSCEFARFYYLVCTYVIADQELQLLCSEKEFHAWFLFEKAILAIVHEHPSLGALFFTISNNPGLA